MKVNYVSTCRELFENPVVKKTRECLKFSLDKRFHHILIG